MFNLLIILPLYLVLLIFFVIGSAFNNEFNVIKKKNIIDEIIVGFSLFVVFTYHSYFVLNINNIFLTIFLLVFVFIYHFKFFKNFKINKNILTKYSLIIFILFLIFLIPIGFSGEQFYVFRGNNWDSFNYLSSALLFNSYSYNDLLDEKIINKFDDFQSIREIILYRPYINYLLSLFLNFKLFDIFLINFSFKIFLSIINFFAFLSFINIFEKFNEIKKIFLSFIFSFSFFSLYVFEIDALSHLASISLFLISTKYMYIFFLNEKNKYFKNIIFISLLNSALFIIYPEIYLFYIIILFLYFCGKVFFLKSKINYKKIVLFIFSFFILTICSYNTNYKFLLLQISHALTSNVDWWGYYGAFIFGRENLVLELDYINLIQEKIKNKSIIELVKLFYFDHINNGYNFILLNIVPSIFGMYHLAIGKLDDFFSYINLTIIIFLNFYLLYIIKNNIIFFKKKDKHIYISIVIIFLIILYLIINGNFWTVIKLYSFSLIFIFIFISINFKKNSFNNLIVIFLIIFPFYKYSSLEYGIGRIDSFPSIINKNNKININWNLQNKDMLPCDKIISSENEYFIKSYIHLKSLYLDKTFNNLTNLNDKKNIKTCKVTVIEKNFVVTSIK